MIQKMIVLFLMLWLLPLVASYKSIYYPIHQHENKVYYVHQLPSGQLSFVCFDTNTHLSEPLLPLLNNPIHITFLPSEQGFSFVDNGIFKVKYFMRRSAQCIEPEVPLFGFASCSWVKDTWCLLSAYYAHNQGIFMVNVDGKVMTLLWHEKKHYSFPSLINNSLFCVLYDVVTNDYSVIMLPDWGNNDGAFPFQAKRLRSTSICTFKQPVVFLTMVSYNLGYFLSYQMVNEALHFSCYQLANLCNGWCQKKLFDFVIPLTFLDCNSSTEWFVESIRPLLPHYNQDTIYYATYDYDDKKICPRKYYVETGATEKMKTGLSAEIHQWVSLVVDGNYYLGWIGNFLQEGFST